MHFISFRFVVAHENLRIQATTKLLFNKVSSLIDDVYHKFRIGEAKLYIQKLESWLGIKSPVL